jgi:hypothetical protein
MGLFLAFARNFSKYFINFSIYIFFQQVIEIYRTSLFNDCLTWFINYVIYDVLNMFNTNIYNMYMYIVNICIKFKFFKYTFFVSAFNWLHYNYFQPIFFYNLSLENLNLFQEFYFASSLLHLKLENSYLNFDLNRLNLFNFWTDSKSYVTRTPLTILS